MVAGHAVDSGLCEARSAEDVAAADDNGDPYTGLANFRNLTGDPANDGRIDTKILTTQQRFAAELQKYALVCGFSHPSPVA